MAFDHGNMTFRVCALPQPVPSDALERFAAEAAGPLDQIFDEPVWGWVSGRFLLETTIDETTAKFGPYIHVCLRQAERKIPASLLTAECRLAELAQMRAENTDRLNRKQLKAIKEEIQEKLLPKMPPTFSGSYIVIDPVDNFLYTSATSEKQLDILTGYFAKVMGFDPIPLTPDNLALYKFSVDPATIPAVNISPEIDDANGATGLLGENFLTWLWFFQEERNGVLPRTQQGDFSLLIDGPLTFVAEGAGSFESSVRKGTPTNSAEARAAMMVGKKLRSAKIILAHESGDEWSCTMDAGQFIFRGLKLPEGDSMDPIGIFTERMGYLTTFRKVIFELFRLYVNTVTDPEKMQEYRRKAKEWVNAHACN